MAINVSGNTNHTSDQVTSLVLTDTCAVGDAIGFDGTNWIRADANAAAPIRAEWFALEASAASPTTILVAKKAIVSGTYTAVGVLLYLSATAGAHTETNPIAVASLVQVVGKAISTTAAFLDAEYPHLTVTASPAIPPGSNTAFGIFFVADRNWRLIAARESHRTAGSDVGAVTLQLEKLTTGQAEGTGVAMLTTTFNLKSTADTPVAVGPSATVANTRLIPGDRIAFLDSGAMTSVANVCVTVTFVEDL